MSAPLELNAPVWDVAPRLLGWHVCRRTGQAYVYFIYGIYHCLNVMAHSPDAAGAVLIRALDHPACNGPGKLCRFLQIDRTFTEMNLFASESLWLEPGTIEGPVLSGPRIGIRKAVEFPWRFWVGGNRNVSR